MVLNFVNDELDSYLYETKGLALAQCSLANLKNFGSVIHPNDDFLTLPGIE